MDCHPRRFSAPFTATTFGAANNPPAALGWVYARCLFCDTNWVVPEQALVRVGKPQSCTGGCTRVEHNAVRCRVSRVSPKQMAGRTARSPLSSSPQTSFVYLLSWAPVRIPTTHPPSHLQDCLEIDFLLLPRFSLLFRGTAAPGAWPLRPSRDGCPGGDARTGIVCTTRTHHGRRVQAGVPFSGCRPLPNSIARWTLSRVCGTPSTENVRAYAVVLQTVPTRSSRTAFSSPHLLCQYLDNARSDDSCHLTTSHHGVDSAPSLVRNTLPCPRLDLSAQRPWSASCSDRGPPLRPTHRPRSQGSGLTVLSPEIMSTNEL